MLRETIRDYWSVILLFAISGGFVGGVIAAGLIASNTPTQEPKQTICVEGTYLQPDNTCLPPNSISMKDK